jgi:hypothetical protein
MKRQDGGHKNLLDTYTFFFHDNDLWIVMRLMDRGGCVRVWVWVLTLSSRPWSSRACAVHSLDRLLFCGPLLKIYGSLLLRQRCSRRVRADAHASSANNAHRTHAYRPERVLAQAHISASFY